MPRYLVLSARITLGLIFLVMGLNGLFHFFSINVEGEKANAFMSALRQAEYFWPFEKMLETIFGVCLLTKRFVPLAVEGLLPIIVNIMLYHIFLDLHGIFLALIVLFCEIILYIFLWPTHFKEMFRSKCHTP